MSKWNRRIFIKSSALSAAAFSLFPTYVKANSIEKTTMGPRFKISLAQWSLHRALQSGTLNHLDFAQKTATDFGIFAVEYVNQFFPDKYPDPHYLMEMNRRADDYGVKQLLIMVDGEGGLAEPDDKKRNEAVMNHHKWLDAAKMLGCHSIRVNAFGSTNDRSTLHAAAVDGLGSLSSYAAPMGINVIVENHGGLSSDGNWLSGVMREINMSNCGTLPDFGNFCLREERDDRGQSFCAQEYDRYTGVEQLLRYAKAVSAKSFDFDSEGNETKIDFVRMVDILKKSSYTGYLGIEYEGQRLSEEDGILATKNLLSRLID